MLHSVVAVECTPLVAYAPPGDVIFTASLIQTVLARLISNAADVLS